MSRIEIIEERCKGCLLCTEACPKELLHRSERLNRLGYMVVECRDKDGACTGCTACATMCPDVAIRVFRTLRNSVARGEASQTSERVNA